MVLMFLWMLRWMFRRVLRGFRSRARLRFRRRLRGLSVLRFAARLNWCCRPRRGGLPRRTRGRGARLRRRILTGARVLTRTRICFGCGTRRAQSRLWRWAFRAAGWAFSAGGGALCAGGCIPGRCGGVACGYGVGEISRARRRGNRRMTVIAGSAQFRIAARCLDLLPLCWRRFDMRPSRNRRFCGSGLGANAAIAAIEADSRYADVVHDRFVVDIGEVHGTDVDGRAVIEKMSALPITALVASAAIAETIVHAAVESDLGSPVSGVPNEYGAVGCPISRRPQIAGLRCFNPRTGHPVIILDVITPGPVARRPDITVSGKRRLIIDGQFGRSDADGYVDLRRT